eukprot:497150-Rhodomonas_salina.2
MPLTLTRARESVRAYFGDAGEGGEQAGMGTRTLTSGQYTGMSYGTLVGGGHPLITPIGNRVNYNTGTDILSRSPPAVVFQNQSRSLALSCSVFLSACA